jgi:hypothetical protein
VLKLIIPPTHPPHALLLLKLFTAEDNPSVDGSMDSDDRQMLSDYIVLSGRCYLTEEQEVKIQELVMKMRPELPVLVVVMKKTNVKQYGNLVR